MEIQSLFVYGSLKRGFLREGVWPHSPLHVRSGVIKAELFDLGPYPAIVLPGATTDSADWVLGEVWTIATEHLSETLRILDEVEGYVPGSTQNEYVRKVVDVKLESGESMGAFVYEYANRDRLVSCRRILFNTTFSSVSCAAWPDSLARVPKSYAEE